MSTPCRFLCYIDESGDEGFNFTAGSSEWFVMAGVIVAAQDDLAASRSIDRIKSRLGLAQNKALHWVDRRRHEQRKVIVQEIIKEPATVCVVAARKPGFNRTSRLQKPPALYLYVTRYLLERVSWFVDDQGGRVDCVFEHRSSLSYQELRDYIHRIRQDPRNQIRPVIDQITPRNKDHCKMLQFADSCASAAYAGFQPDRYGNRESSYLHSLRGKLYRRGGNLFSYGLKLLPEDGSSLGQDPDYGWLQAL